MSSLAPLIPPLYLFHLLISIFLFSPLIFFYFLFIFAPLYDKWLFVSNYSWLVKITGRVISWSLVFEHVYHPPSIAASFFLSLGIFPSRLASQVVIIVERKKERKKRPQVRGIEIPWPSTPFVFLTLATNSAGWRDNNTPLSMGFRARKPQLMGAERRQCQKREGIRNRPVLK